MRQTSSLFSLHRRIAVAATNVFIDAPPLSSSFIMSSTSRPPFRGGGGGGGGGGRRGRGRRNFSDHRPHVEPHHHHSSRNATSDFRSINQFNNNNDSNNNSNASNNNNNANYNRCYYNYDNPSNSGGDRGGGGGGSFRGRLRPFNRPINQQAGGRVPRPKPADYRSWEFAKHPPPPDCERFVVLSYNILADYLANSHRKLYFHIPRRFMSWEWRKGNLLFELRLWSPDIMCFQEVDKFHELEEDLRTRGYSGIWKMRTGDPIDGCAIFWRTTRFKLMYEECIEFNKHVMRDNVAQICVLESLIPNKHENQSASLTSSGGPKRVVICNIHVLYNPRRGEIKLGQVRTLLERAQAVSKMWDDAPVVLCGDFNCTPMSPLYNFMSEQKLDISEVDRDKISGQASAVLQPPPRLYNSQPREQPTGNVASPTTVQNYTADSKQSDSQENDNHQTPVSLQQPSPVDSLLNVPINTLENNTEKIQLNVKLPDNHDGHTDMNNVKSDDPLINETLKGPECTSVSSIEVVSSSDMPLKEQEIKEVIISSDSSWTGNSNRLSSVTDDSNKNIREHETRDNDNSYMSHSDNTFCSASESVQARVLGAISEPDPTSEASDTSTVSALNYDVVEKISGLSLDEINETVEVNEDLGENADESLSDLSIEGDAFPPNLGDLVPEEGTINVEIPCYDPSLWTPMEIATATGDANRTILEHALNLKSTYSEVVGSSGTRDSIGEPLATSYNTCFMGTVDYIWRSEGLYTSKVLAPISKDAMQPSGGFPTKKWGSDHIALASELAFVKK